MACWLNETDMQTLTIRTDNPHAVRLIEELAAMHLIEIEPVEKRVASGKQKLSERMAGSITPDQADQMRRELQQSRDEWENC
jgi:hypothetical protein